MNPDPNSNLEPPPPDAYEEIHRMWGGVPARRDWQDDASCRGSDVSVFFPQRGGSSELARSICERCPVVRECYEMALSDSRLKGIFGGTSERQRRRIRTGDAPPPEFVHDPIRRCQS